MSSETPHIVNSAPNGYYKTIRSANDGIPHVLLQIVQGGADHLARCRIGKSCAVNLNHPHDKLQDLVERVTIELELTNVAQELER